MEQESFRLLGESADVRVGVRSVDGEEIGIEVLVRLVPLGPTFDLPAARMSLERLEALLDRHYQLTAQEGWWVVGEKAVDPQEVASEGRFVFDLFTAVLGKP